MAAGILYIVGASMKLQELSWRAHIADSYLQAAQTGAYPQTSNTNKTGPYLQMVQVGGISLDSPVGRAIPGQQGLSVESTPPGVLVSQRPRSRASVAVIVIAAIAFAGIIVLGGSGIVKEQTIKSNAVKGLEKKYGEKFVALDLEVDRGIPFLPDDSYDLACAPASNKELIFSAYSISEEDDDPLEHYIERVAAEDCKKLIKPTLDKIASNYAIETNAYFSTEDIDVNSGWKEFATAEYAVRSKGEILSFVFIDKSSMKGLDYGEEYDLLTEMIDNTFPTWFSLDIEFTDSDIVKKCDEYIAHNLTTWSGYESILDKGDSTNAFIDRNSERESEPDTTRDEYITARETGHQTYKN
jgi:hypothetical protein